MYKVETHDNSKEYYESLQIEKEAIYITPTTNFAYMISENTNVSERDKWRIIDIDTIINLVYKKRNRDLNKLKLKSEVRLIINQLIMNTQEIELLKILRYLNDNMNILISDIERFIDAKVSNFKYERETSIKKAIALIYAKLVRTKIYNELIEEVLHIEKAKNFYSEVEGFDGTEIKKIYVYNLNNLGLNRWLILNMFKYAGFEIIFKVPHFKGLRVSNKCWDNLYLQADIFELSYDESFKKKNYFDYKFIRFLEGLEYSSKELIDEKVITKTYVQIGDFKRDIKNKKIITFYKDSIKACKDRVRADEKDNYKLGHCFQSAIGRFISNLYKCRVKNSTVELNFGIYIELITSGWIEDSRGWNGIRLKEYLSGNIEYFDSINDMDEILERLYALRDLAEVNHIFEDYSKNKIKDDLQKRLLLNPLRALGYNNTEQYSITVNYIIQLTIKLKNTIVKALGIDDIVEINKHLEALREVFKNKYTLEKSKNGTEEDKLITKKIWWMLNKEELFPKEMHRDDILELASIVLKIKNNEKVEEVDLSIDHLESVIYRKKRVGIGEYKRIILTDLSYESYEGYIKERTTDEKILSRQDITEILSNSLLGAHKKIVLEGNKLNNISNNNVDMYLKFLFANLFINFDGIKELSWVDGLRENDTKSIILKQIEAIYENEIKETQGLDFDDIVSEGDMKLQNIISYDYDELGKNYNKYADVAYRNLDFCNRKFLYASVLNHYPVYYSDFHSKLIFSGLVSILKNSIEDSYSNISKFIFPLFPQWQEVVKSNILVCEYGKKNIREYKYYDGINYPKNIDTLYLLKSSYIVGENWKIKNRYNNEKFNAKEYYNTFISVYLKGEEFNGGKHCMMCPYINICKKGEFIIDNK